MRKLALAIFLVEAAILVAVLPAPRVDAGDVVARALADAAPAALELGDFTWIEECGLGVKLPAAPPQPGNLPCLLAGERMDDARSAGLWELGPRGADSLISRLEGARADAAVPAPFRPRRHSMDVVATRTGLNLPSGRRGTLVDWVTSGRRFGLLVTDSTLELAQRRADDLLRELVQLEGVGPDCMAPLAFQGRYAYVLRGWTRDGDRLRKRTSQGWLSLRVFEVQLTDFENVGRLQFELETRLDAAGFKRSAGLKPNIAGSEGFIGQYDANDGFLQRIAYAKLEQGYLVALMQAPEALRANLTEDMDALARTMQATGIGGGAGASPLFFGRVRNVRVHAWQDGQRVLWGALFDDSRQQPVVWREDGISWNIQLTRAGQMIREREGTVNSSRALNPLVDSELRALDLPQDFAGDVELQLTVNGERANTRLSIR